MNYSLLLAALTVGFFVLLLLAIQFGKWLGRNADETSRSGTAAIEASVFALLGLLVAFTFSGAAQRLNDRRNIIVQEVNAIGTAWLRIDLLNASDQPALRDEFRRYVDARIAFYTHMTDFEKREAAAAQASVLQKAIWAASIRATRNVAPPLAVSYVGAVNDMFDVSTTLTVAQKIHPPAMAYVFLCFLALVSAALVGFNLAVSKRGSWTHQMIYAVVMTAAMYIIVDFEFPRVGTIRIDQSDALLIAQRQSMVDPDGIVQQK